MRLGGPIFRSYNSPAQWVNAVREKGYRAAYCPVGLDAGDAEIQAYARAAQEADIVIAEVGAWSNPLSPNPQERQAALEKCIASLRLAEKIGARCCVNIAGSRGAKWDGPDPADLTAETFERIVECVRTIIDAVQPERTFYTLEPMPWMYPDSVESYRALIAAIARPAFAVHLDPVNWVNSPARYFNNRALLQQAFQELGAQIRSCHAKDVILRDQLTVHLDEVRPGLGGLDYAAFLRLLAQCDPDLPLMLEHLPSEDEYDAAAAYVRATALQAGVQL